MSSTQPPSFKGRYFGLAVLVGAQLIVGLIHVVFGVWLLVASNDASSFIFSLGDVYYFYTFLYGLLTLLFAIGVWYKKNWGWYGTLAVSIFVIVADSLKILGLPSVPGIPMFAGFGEIPYSIIIVAYLLQSHVRTDYKNKQG